MGGRAHVSGCRNVSSRSACGAVPFEWVQSLCEHLFLMPQRMERILANNIFDVLHCREPCTLIRGCGRGVERNAPVVGTFHAALDDSVLYRYLYPVAKKT